MTRPMAILFFMKYESVPLSKAVGSKYLEEEAEPEGTDEGWECEEEWER